MRRAEARAEARREHAPRLTRFFDSDSMTTFMAAEGPSGFRLAPGLCPGRSPTTLRVAVKTNPSTREIRVQIESRFEFLDLVQQMAEDVCRVSGFRRDTMLNVGLAVREAVVNAIKHGNRHEAGKRVEVVFRMELRKLVVAVRDQGTGFDPDRLRNPLDAGNIFRANGRGIFFMKSFVDDVAFQRLHRGGMEVRMEKRLENRRRRRHTSGAARVREGGEVG
jgi:serine/threonine-protein kinase RsbW